jgi:hypothetical protein
MIAGRSAERRGTDSTRTKWQQNAVDAGTAYFRVADEMASVAGRTPHTR